MEGDEFGNGWKGAFPYELPPIGPAPCDGCGNRKACATGLACPDFSAFVFQGKRVESDRRASGRVYRRVFAEVDGFIDRQAPEVLKLFAQGHSYRSIARQLDLSKDKVMDIVQRDRANR